MSRAIDKLPAKCWAVLDGDDLALVEGQMPLFWRRSVAVQFNKDRLAGTGRIVRVTVSLKS